MRGRLTTLTEVEKECGYRFMIGRLGDLDVRLHPVGTTGDGRQKWELTVLTPSAPKTKDAERNAKGWRRRQREREGVESLGGTEQ
jgi:hypothetical protein